MLPNSLIIGSFFVFHAFIGTQATVWVITDFDLHLNPEYFDQDFEAFLLDDGNDNEICFNMTIIKTLPEYSTVHFKMMGATMGEYKVPIGIDYVFDTCQLIKEPILGEYILRNLGFERCPVQPGVYGHTNLIIDLDNFPDSFIRNKYLVLTEMTSNDNEVIYTSLVYLTAQ